MTTFRNILIVSGAALGAGFVVNTLRLWLLYPLTGLSALPVSQVSAIAWSFGCGALVGVLAGSAAGIALRTDEPFRWSVILAFLVFLGSGASIRRGAFTDVLTRATAEAAMSVMSSAIAFAVFHLVRDRVLRGAVKADAR